MVDSCQRCGKSTEELSSEVDFENDVSTVSRLGRHRYRQEVGEVMKA